MKSADKKRIVFISGFFPEKLRSEIERNSRGPIQNAADALQRSLIRGLEYYFQVSVINMPFLGSFPLKYKKAIVRTFSYPLSNSTEVLNVGYSNLFGYKIFSRYVKCRRYLDRVAKYNHSVLLVYSLHTPFLMAAVEYKRSNPATKICVIVPDLPQFMGGPKGLLFSILKSFDKRLIEECLKQVDCFVILSDHMHGPLQIGDRPWTRVEGIYSEAAKDKAFNEEPCYFNKEHKNIFYSGTLAKRYGILNLLEAFERIENNKFRLWICGEGECKEAVIEKAEVDKRIQFLGQLPREQVLALQSRATLLVNPRTSEGEYTKYSFPSKIMEYLGSGVPSVMYKLEGIPSEYYQYFFTPSSETIKDLTETIVYVCELSSELRAQFGERAKTFVKETKTAIVQCKNIFDLLNS